MIRTRTVGPGTAGLFLFSALAAVGVVLASEASAEPVGMAITAASTGVKAGSSAASAGATTASSAAPSPVPASVSPAPTGLEGKSPAVPDSARQAAAHAAATHGNAVIRTLGELVAFPTVHEQGRENRDHPSFKAMTAYLKKKAAELELDFVDHGAVVVIGLGKADRRLGLITHGDVQPAVADKWARSPFSLDQESEPGLLIARGAEDDKGSIAAALYAMRTLKELNVPLERRIELIVSYTEESDWSPFVAFLEKNPPPDLNIAMDAEYPAVVAEKGFGLIQFTVKPQAGVTVDGTPATLRTFNGGAFMTQIPESAMSVIDHVDAALTAKLKAVAQADTEATYSFQQEGTSLTIRVKGVSAHSSKPQEGINALSHLAAVLATHPWPPSASASMVRFMHDLVGSDHLGQKFGQIAFSHPFMGPLTSAMTLVKEKDGRLEATINLRIPEGKPKIQLEQEIREAIDGWRKSSGVEVGDLQLYLADPYYRQDAPQLPQLLAIFSHFTGAVDPKPIAVGGGTHARLVPNGVNFGPAMPNEKYTGHTEHEFISRDQLLLNLKMYTAMLDMLAGRTAAGGMP